MQMIPFWLQLQGGPCSMDIFGHLPSGFFQVKSCSYQLTFASISPDYCTTQRDSEGNQASLSGFQGLILSKTYESHSNSVAEVSSSLQMKMQIQPTYILSKSMYAEFPVCWHQLFGSASEVRNTKHRDSAGNQRQSHELPFRLLLLF